MKRLAFIAFLMVSLGLNAQFLKNPFTTNNPVPPSAIATAGGITNLLKVQIMTNNYAYIQGFGYTNFPSSTSCGINEVVNLYPFLNPFTNNPFASGLKIELGAGDFFFSGEINLGTNNISITGQSQWTSVLRWVGSTNHTHLIYEPCVQPSANHMDAFDFSVVVSTNFLCTIMDLTNDIMNMARVQVVGPQNINNGTWNYVIGNTMTNTALPGLVGISIASGVAGGNIHSFQGVKVAGCGVGIYVSDANWVDIGSDSDFYVVGNYNPGSGTLFSNMWPIGDPRHCAAAVINNAPVGLTKVHDSHFLTCRAKIACTGGSPTEDFDNQNESCPIEDLNFGNAYMNYIGYQGAPPVSPSYGLDANFNTNGACPVFSSFYISATPNGSTTTSWQIGDGSNNVAHSFGVVDNIGGNGETKLGYGAITMNTNITHFTKGPMVVNNPILQQTNVTLSTATSFTWQFGQGYSDTNYSVTVQGAAAAIVNPVIGAKTTTSVVVSFTAFTGQLDLISTHQ